ncbi:MAG: ATP-binding protein [Candidatus Thermoplasmatota archaeon]|nr:ATP-binding protein [Candidatus Thermoplasmatota archaeon]
MEAADLIEFNPWWSSGQVPERLLEDEKRDLFQEIQDLLSNKQIVSIVGLRRTGKTTLMYQLIDYLLENGVPEERIMYFSFDKKVSSIEEIIDTYKQEIIMEDEVSKESYLFLDEIQKLDDWENKIKLLYDKNLPIKLLLSGSSSLTLKKNSKETLAGRNYVSKLPPLTFKEYLKLSSISHPEFTDIKKTYNETHLDEDKFVTEFHRFVNFHGLPETIGMDEDLTKKYIRSSLIDQVIYKDIPSDYDIGDPSVIEELLRIIAERPGMLLRFESLASDLSRTRQTISKYIFYLENSFLLKMIYNYSGSFITSAKKLKKVYFTHPCIANTLKRSRENIGRLVENHIINELDTEFFHRRQQKEVDALIRYDESILPVEIKYKQNIKNKDEEYLRDFMDKQELERGLMLTKDTFEVEEEQILKIPSYYFLLFKESILQDFLKKR